MKTGRAAPRPVLRRWLLVALAVASLVALLYASIATAMSVEVTREMAAANAVEGSLALQGWRALVVPPSDAQQALGELIVWGASPSGFPSGTREAGLGRALAYVAPDENGTFANGNRTLAVGFVENGTRAEENVTVDVAALAGAPPRAGYLVSGDAERGVRFVNETDVIGTVARFESPGSLAAMFSFGGVGFVAPLVALILTQRKSGVQGAPDGALACPECRRPLEAGASFCAACGAWLPGKAP